MSSVHLTKHTLRFNPSQPYVRDYIIHHYDITDATLRDQVYAWDVLAELLAGILMAGLYVLTGPIAPLLISNLGAFLMTAVLVFGTSYTALLASQVHTHALPPSC